MLRRTGCLQLTWGIALAFLLSSCATERQTRALYGASLGAAIGAAAASGLGDDDKGLAVGLGAGVGALVGGVLGYYSAEEPKQRCWNGSMVGMDETCPPKQKRCWDGSMVGENESCPPRQKECWDGSTVSVDDDCPPQKECWDGSEVGMDDDCPRIILRGINFDFDEAAIKAEFDPVLDEAARTLMENPDVNVLIEGHTDARGRESYNQRLSERRAAAVKDYLVGKGVAADRLEAVGRGENDPVAPNMDEDGNDHPDGRAMNRRVELITR